MTESQNEKAAQNQQPLGGNGAEVRGLVTRLATLWKSAPQEMKCAVYDAFADLGVVADMAINYTEGPRATVLGTPKTADEIEAVAWQRYYARNNPAA